MALTPDKILELRENRRASLLAKWGAGARLSPDELAEIADLIAAPKDPRSSPAIAETASPPLVLESSPAVPFSSRSGCIHPIIPGSPYETTYAASIRTIKTWRAKGAAASPSDYPPLDEPHRMAAWYRRIMERRVPARLIELEHAGPPKPPAPIPHDRESPPSLLAGLSCVSGERPQPNDTGLETGYAATLSRLERAEAIAARRWTEAYESEDAAVRETASRLKKEWVDLTDTVRAYQRDASKVLRESGQVWDAGDVMRVITDMHSVIAPGVRRLLRRFRQLNPAIAAALESVMPEARQDELFSREADALFSALIHHRFTASTLPSAESPAEVTPA